MTLDDLGRAIVIGSLVVLVAVIGVRFAGRLGVPAFTERGGRF